MSSRFSIIISILIGLFGLATLSAILFFTVIYPKQTIDYIEIHGLGEKQVLSNETNKYIESLKGLRYTDIDPENIESYLIQQGPVASVNVLRKYPGNLYIDIIPKDPIAVFVISSFGDPESKELVINADSSYHLGYEELIYLLQSVVPKVEILISEDEKELETQLIQDAFRYIPMFSELKEAAPDIYNLISEVKYDTNNNRGISVGLIYTGVHMDFVLFDPISGVRLEEAIRAAITIGRGDTSETSLQYMVFDTYMVESVI